MGELVSDENLISSTDFYEPDFLRSARLSLEKRVLSIQLSVF